MRKFFHNTGIVLNIIAIIPLLLSYLSVYISPAKVWFLAFFGLAFPVFVVINLLFIIFWIFRLKLAFLISLIALLIGIGHISHIFQIFCNKKKIISEPSLKVLTYNVRLYDVYNWSKDNNEPEKILKFISEQNADIVCFQEFMSSTVRNIQTFDTTKFDNNLKYQCAAFTKHTWNNLYYGIATFSAYPIVGKGTIRFKNSVNMVLITDIKVNDDTFRIYNVHLQSIHFDRKDYQFLDSLNLKYDHVTMNNVKDISRKLKAGFIQRSHQVDSTALHIAQSPYPVIVCGDFNDTPISYTYHKISKDLIDSFTESGCGLEFTYSGMFPSFRIDYILHSNSLSSFNYSKTKINYSDHYPVQCEFRIK